MTISAIIDRIKDLRPTLDEIKKKYKGIGSKGAASILNTFELQYRPKEGRFSNTIEELVTCTNIHEMIWAGIQFNSSYKSLPKDITRGFEFAGFYDNVLAVDNTTKEVVYMDFYQPNQNYIDFRCAENPEKLMDTLLYLLEIDLDFQFQGKEFKGIMLNKLIQLAGGDKYRLFYQFVHKGY